jgi:serine/threonine protein kinase
MIEKTFYKRQTLAEFEEEETPAIPQQIGGYKIESLLNKGGMSVLYLGIHPETHEPLAIKVLSSHYVSHPEMVERFLREASIIELTNHPNIVRLYGHGRWEGGLFIAMEFIQGISLRQLILQQTLSLKRSLEMVLQISHALTHLHSHGIVHRDLKPENILLTAHGGIKVIDFGIAGIFAEKGSFGSKAKILGTPDYMSPEQKEDPLHASFSSDIYSLGIVTYELILGRLSHGMIHLALVPRGLQKILAKALQPKPEDRYEDIVDFISDVSKYLTSSELKRDMRGSDYLGELSENLKEAQALIVPSGTPNWPRIDVAVASNSNTAISSVYYDFFEQKDGVFTIVIGESLATGVEGLLHIAILRGMIRSLAPLIQRPSELIQIVNQHICEEEKEQTYCLSYLTLKPTINSFSYISCGYSPLWYLPAGTAEPRRISAENIALGISPQIDVIEVESNWDIGDRIVLHTFQAGLSKSFQEVEFDEEQFLEALQENVFFPPQRQVDAIFRKVSKKEERTLFERPVTVISLERKE